MVVVYYPGLRRRLLRFVMWTAVPAAAVVWAANNGFDQERMKESLRSTGRRIKGKVTGKQLLRIMFVCL